MGSVCRCGGLVLGPCLTLLPPDGCAGRDRAIVGCVGAAEAEPRPLGSPCDTVGRLKKRRPKSDKHRSPCQEDGRPLPSAGVNRNGW